MPDVIAAAIVPPEAIMPGEDVRNAVADAEVLLGYAAEAGIDVAPELVDAVLATHADIERGACTRAGLVAFYAALTRIAVRLNPVTADTIRACASKAAARSLARNRLSASILTFIIIVMSILAFVDSSVASRLSGDIRAANELAVGLRSKVDQPGSPLLQRACAAIATPPAAGAKSRGLDDLTDLQQFAAGLRDIYGRAIKLNYFVFLIEQPPVQLTSDNRDRLQLNPALVNFDAEVVCKISTYEEVRDFAQNILLDNTVAFGALATYVLPVAYALLGAMAFRLRTFADTIRKRTYHPSYADSARLMAALIAGAIVSLFGGFGAGITLSPLALGFLVGYGVEMFFTFLDTILNSFGAGKDGRKVTAAS